MSIRIISSRKFRFYNPDRSDNVVVEGKNIISTVPDWALQDGTFQAARSAGLIQILSSRQEERVAENNPEKLVPQSAHDHGAKEEVEEEVVEDQEPSLFPEGDQDDERVEEESEEDAEAAKKAAKKAARAARRAKKAKQ